MRVGLSSFTTFKSVTAGAGLTIMNFLVVDYAFESHPVFSPVHRVSISFSPYLFGHNPKGEGHLNKTAASKKLVTEEPEELPIEDSVGETAQEAPATAAPAVQSERTVESAAPVNPAVNVESTDSATTTAPVSKPSTNATPAPIVETDDEILE